MVKFCRGDVVLHRQTNRQTYQLTNFPQEGWSLLKFTYCEEMTMMRVIITGGTGLIGRALAQNLAQDGYEVVVLSRNPGTRPLPAGINVEKWDGKTAAHWGHLLNGNSAIVNLAGENIAGSGFPPARWTAERKQRILQSRLDAGTAVVQAIQQATEKPKVLLQSSAVGYYGPRGSELITASTPPGNDFLADVCVQWERVTDAVEQMGVRRVLLRTGVVLSMKGGALPLMALPIKLFAGGPLGSGEQYVPWIHLEDEVRAIRFLLEHEEASGPFNLSAPNPLTYKEFGKELAAVLKRPFFLPTPAFALKLALGEMATIVLDGQHAVPDGLQALGFSFKYTQARAALQDLLHT